MIRRYLDREAQPGDRVHIEYEAVVSRRTEYGETAVRVVVPVTSDQSGRVTYFAPSTATVRVIASEPKVGDVVTEDMDLPIGTIVEREVDRSGDGRFVAKKIAVATWATSGAVSNTTLLSLMADADYPWRIVRIGGAS